MYKKNKMLSFIGARSGSKGLKNKNIIDFAGKPLINWTIEASINSKYIDSTIVSTESSEIAEIAENAGAEIPFLRPLELSGDEVPLIIPIKHSIGWLRENNMITFDYIIDLLPTCPLRTTEHIDKAIEYYFQNKKTDEDALISVKSLPQKYGWLMKLKEDGYLEFCLNKSSLEMQRQSLPNLYLPNGAIFIGKTSVVEQKGFYTEQIMFFPMEASTSVDIDTKDDLDNALKLFNRKENL